MICQTSTEVSRVKSDIMLKGMVIGGLLSLGAFSLILAVIGLLIDEKALCCICLLNAAGLASLARIISNP